MDEKRGLTVEEAANVRRILSDPALQQKHAGYRKQINGVLYWALLFVLIVGNLLAGLVLVPVLLIFTPAYTALVLFFVGAAFGLFFHLLITDLEHVEQRHKMLAGAIIPLTAVVDIFIMVAIAQAAARRLGIVMQQEPFWLVISYVVAFLLPSILSDLFVPESKKALLK